MVDHLSTPGPGCPPYARWRSRQPGAAWRGLGKAATALAGLAVAGAVAAGPQVQVLQPWVQAAPPKAKVVAAYMVLHNTGSEPQTLVGAASSAFGQVEIHRTVMHGAMAHMEAVARLPLPPGQKVALEPGGLHLMLIGPKQPLTLGTRIPITLSLDGGATLAVDAVVRAPAGKGAGDGNAAGHAAHQGHAQ